MAVTDLTGTTWTMNDSVDISTEQVYLINFETLDGIEWEAIEISEEMNPEGVYYYSEGTPELVCYQGISWADSDFQTIAITGGTDATNSTLIAWLEANATQQGGGGGGLTVTYNNNTIHTSTADDTFTLQCNGKLMATDITITANGVNSYSVSYNGSNIINAQTASKTIKCGGKVMASNLGFDVTMSAATPNTITVVGLGSSNPASVTFTTDGTFNWNFEEVTVNGNVFIRIPTMYRKVKTVLSSQITSFTLADAQVDSSYQPYPCFVNGNSILPYVLIGKYCSSSTSVMNSVNATAATQTLANARTNARALGTGYQLYDWQFQKLFVDLALCHKQNVNFNSGKTINEYLGVAHLANSTLVDGVYHNGTTWYASDDPSKYVSNPSSHPPTGYYALSYACPSTSGTAREVKSLGYDANHPFINYPSSTTSSTNYNTYYCDSYSYSAGSRLVSSYVGYASASCGLWYCSTGSSWTTTNRVRLCYKPLQ